MPEAPVQASWAWPMSPVPAVVEGVTSRRGLPGTALGTALSAVDGAPPPASEL